MDMKNVNSLTLAYYGDAVYESFVRGRIIENSINSHAGDLHKKAVKYVCAKAQANIIKTMIDNDILTEDEQGVARRARNHKIATKAKNADPLDYKWATAFEALIGWLKLTNQEERLLELMNEAARIVEA